MLKTLAQLKNEQYRQTVVGGTIAGTPFSLFPLTHGSASDDRIVTPLAKWRKAHEVWFPSQFPVSVERTRAWLDERVLGLSDRILFMIEIDGVYVGHVGLFRFDIPARTCEIDNIVRGERGYPGLMTEAIRTMMAWGREKLGVVSYELETTSDNEKAITLYRRLGFSEVSRIPVTYKKTDEGGEWVDAKGNDPIGRYTVYMSL